MELNLRPVNNRNFVTNYKDNLCNWSDTIQISISGVCQSDFTVITYFGRQTYKSIEDRHPVANLTNSVAHNKVNVIDTYIWQVQTAINPEN